MEQILKSSQSRKGKTYTYHRPCLPKISRTPVPKVTEEQLPMLSVKYINQCEISSSVRSNLDHRRHQYLFNTLLITVTRRHFTCSFPLNTEAFNHEIHSFREGSFNLNPEKENNVARKKVQDDAHHLWSLWRSEGIKSKRNPIKNKVANCY